MRLLKNTIYSYTYILSVYSAGGWRVRAALAQALFIEPDILLLVRPLSANLEPLEIVLLPLTPLEYSNGNRAFYIAYQLLGRARNYAK